MIHIDLNLSGVEPPAILHSDRAEKAKREALETYKNGVIQDKFVFDDEIISHTEVVTALQQVFHKKCAYCETPLAGFITVDHHRPKLQAVNLDGKIDPYHYFWLAYEWTNLFSVCPECSRNKGTRFPVNGNRAAIGAGLEELGKEEALLLNPYQDAPEQHLVFSSDGLVTSAKEKGRVTIEILGLNRADLVGARRDEYFRLLVEIAGVLAQAGDQEGLSLALAAVDKVSDKLDIAQSLSDAVRALLRALDQAGDREAVLYHTTESMLYTIQLEGDWAMSLTELNDPAKPFAGMRRQFVGEWMQKLIKKSPELETFSVYQEVVQLPIYSKRQQQAIKSGFKRYTSEQNSYSLNKEEDNDRYYLRTRWIEKVELHNFKIIKDLTLYPTAGKLGEGPWLMLLGENGTGKSSILQAIALSLIGDEYRAMLKVTPQEVLRNRTQSGFVKIYLTGMAKPIELHFSRGDPDFKRTLSDPKILLLGYGATRLLPRGDTQPMPGTEFAHVDNLFNPFIPLKDASKWLYELNEKDSFKFENVARAVKNLLTLEEAEGLVCDPDAPDQVNMRSFGQTVSIKRQSDGYQTVLALVCDVMAILLERWEAMEVAEGIVLIDEIGSHLHPRWQMQVIQSLRQVFPRVQFLATTHYPLCLRGLHNQEVVVLQRSLKNQVIAIDEDLPTIEGMRVDQLLTSEYFGLNSTIDPDLESQFNEYYQLLALPKHTKHQEIRLQELKAQLDLYRVFGSTRRERLALEAVDQFLAQEPEIVSLDERSELKKETKRKVAEMWAKLREKK